MPPDELLEALAELEHEQWTRWSQEVAGEVDPQRRRRWQAYWTDYRLLPDDVKEADRAWARKVLTVLSRFGLNPPGRP